MDGFLSSCIITQSKNCLALFSRDEVKDTSLKAKAKDIKIVLEDPQGRGLVLEDSNTGKHRIKCFGEAPYTLHICSVISNGQNSMLLPLKSFVLNMQ